ncbi:NUDIX domain-containing protein [Paenibacillus psychroresistens]|uniref:NUDIX domain-containing protein n=1 Tax=Paenibacillus psychroresistens TaxID=1778678 RepID=A0A6B8RUD8_9BACL|nr:NUDIX domain-containing protein [Paenibacillus psychroresistens]QGQ99063.1 NUDIX domain-containing protein [Paenibacillus psychroresistens]
MTHVRIRCTGLIVENNSILLVEYDDNGIHYNLPGGGLELGETILEGVAREVFEETTAEVEVGPLALIYELAPHKQSGDYNPIEKHSLHLIFECSLKNNSKPQLPQNPDLNQSDVKWIPLEELNSILLIPNINQQIINYIKNKRNIDFIEDYQLDRLRLEQK